MITPLLLLAASTGVAHAAVDPCTLATAATWVSSKTAHACELNVPFNKTRSLSVVGSTIKALQYYSLENWFLHSPNPLIPHDVNVRALLENVQTKTSASGFKTDWDFNMAVADAFDREADGHTVFTPFCTEAFSWNLPFSIATLAESPFDKTAFPTFLVNYDFPNQGRDGLEAYFESIGVHVRPFDGARILTIDGVDASTYLVQLATESSIFKGLVGAYETVNPRYMRLMARYSADTVAGLYTLEVGRFGQRAFYPGADSVTLTLQTSGGKSQTVTVPWAATFVGSGNTTASFIAETCLPPADESDARKRRVERRAEITASPMNARRKGVVAPEAQGPVRQAASAASVAPPANIVQPNLTSFGHFVTLDIYQLAENPKVGVVYFEQFEPSDGTGANDYFNGISDTLFTGLNALKAAGVEKIIVDNSGNRGGFIFAGAIALWSLWPQDLYPGFPAVYRDSDLIRRESDVAAASGLGESEYSYFFYRDLNYVLFKNNTQFMDPPVPQVVNGVRDAYSKQFLDDFGDNSSAVTSFTTPPFAGEDYVFVANSICASTCSIFSSYLFQKHGVRSAVFGGTPSATTSQFDGGVKGSEVTDFDSVIAELELAGLQDDPAAPQPFPIEASLTMNFRNAILAFPSTDKSHPVPRPRPPHLPFRRISLPSNPRHRESVVSVASFDSLPEEPAEMETETAPVMRARKVRPRSTDPREVKRRNVIQEFYETEKAYVDGLELIYEHFLTPIITSLDSSTPLLARADLASVFSNFRPPLACTCRALSLPLIVQPFVTAFPSTIAAITALATPPTSAHPNPHYSPAFAAYLLTQETHPRCGRLKLRDWLLTIVQRCPRYLLLLKDLIGCTPAGPEHTQLTSVHALVSRITLTLNTSIHTHAQTLSLLALQRATPSLPFQLIRPGRALFEDCIVWLEAEGAGYGGGTPTTPGAGGGNGNSNWGRGATPSITVTPSPTRPGMTRTRSKSEAELPLSRSPGDVEVFVSERDHVRAAADDYPQVVLPRGAAALAPQASVAAPASAPCELELVPAWFWVWVVVTPSVGRRRGEREQEGESAIDDEEEGEEDEEEDEGARRFEVLSPEGSFVVYADSEEERDAWTSAIRQTKAALFVSLNATHPDSTLTSSASTAHLRRSLQALPFPPSDERLLTTDANGKGKGGDGKEGKGKLRKHERRGRVEHWVPAIWIPDEKTEGCMRCGRAFGWRRRRHHCRLCGRCVCAGCSERTFFIADPNAKDDSSKPARACNACYETVFPLLDPPAPDEGDLTSSTSAEAGSSMLEAHSNTMSSLSNFPSWLSMPSLPLASTTEALMAIDSPGRGARRDATGMKYERLRNRGTGDDGGAQYAEQHYVHGEEGSHVEMAGERVRVRSPPPRPKSYHQILEDFEEVESARGTSTTQDANDEEGESGGGSEAGSRPPSTAGLGVGGVGHSSELNFGMAPRRERRKEDTARRNKRFSMPAVALQTTSVTARTQGVEESQSHGGGAGGKAGGGSRVGGRAKRFSLVLGSSHGQGGGQGQGHGQRAGKQGQSEMIGAELGKGVAAGKLTRTRSHRERERQQHQHLHASVTPYPLAPHLEGCVLDIGRGGVQVVSVGGGGGGEDDACGASSITTNKNRLRAPSIAHPDGGFDTESLPTAPAAKQDSHSYSTRPLATVTNFDGRAVSAGGPPRKSLPLPIVKTRGENGENIHIHRQSEQPPPKKKESPVRKMPLRYNLRFGTRTSPTKAKLKSERAESSGGSPTKGKAISSELASAAFHHQAADESVDWAARIRSVFYNRQWDVDDDLPESVRDYFFTRDSVGSGGDESVEISKDDDDPLGVRSTRATESLATPGAQAQQSSSELAYLGSSSSSNIGHCDSNSDTAALSTSSSGASGAFNDLLASVDRKYPGRRWVEIVQFSAGDAQDADARGVRPRDKRKRNGLQQWSDIFCLDEPEMKARKKVGGDLSAEDC
ncbi:hypothetical protein C8R46DRAFT_1215363 [Mycena filopes]|nr:hypothetical protein C8R46DRAFT_1215363 [Mycena filopes]